jgi:excisionase family DNA binding protein
VSGRDHLSALVDGLPSGAVVTVRADWIRELLTVSTLSASAPAVELDLTIPEAAALLHRSPQRVRDWVREGRFPHAWRMGREIRIPRADVEALGCAETPPLTQRAT